MLSKTSLTILMYAHGIETSCFTQNDIRPLLVATVTA